MLGEVKQLAAPFDHLALDVDGAVVPAAAVGVDRGGDQLGQHAGRGAGAVHPAPKARVRVAGGVRQDQLARVAAGPLDALTFNRQRLGERLPHRSGDGAPRRPLGHGAQVIQRVIEQPVGQVLEGLPVGGIEGFVWIGLGPAQRHDRRLELWGGP